MGGEREKRGIHASDFQDIPRKAKFPLSRRSLRSRHVLTCPAFSGSGGYVSNSSLAAPSAQSRPSNSSDSLLYRRPHLICLRQSPPSLRCPAVALDTWCHHACRTSVVMIISSASVGAQPQLQPPGKPERQNESRRETEWGMSGGGGFGDRWGSGRNDKTIINRIMLRFRPIAPKPPAGGSGSGESALEKEAEGVGKGRTKRKYVKGKKSNSRCKIIRKAESGKDGFDRAVLTQQLLPEISCRKDSTSKASYCPLDFPMIREIQQLPTCLSFGENPETSASTIGLNGPDRSDLNEVAPPGEAAESWVTVESVTETCMEGGGLGCTDVEIIKSLEGDTCPGFISDGFNRVHWINLAYGKMVWGEEAGGGGGAPPETAVGLVVKAALPVVCPAFACRVRVQYRGGKKEKLSQTMPCDVWRMGFGRFAWRLDVKAALNLGR